jgi:hypothetical protein
LPARGLAACVFTPNLRELMRKGGLAALRKHLLFRLLEIRSPW